jgi:hypothetical protein
MSCAKCMSKKNIILGIILIILVAFAWVWNGPLKKIQEVKAVEKNFLAGISSARVDKVIISNSGKTTELDKSGDVWKIAGEKKFGVDSSAGTSLNSILSELGTMSLEVVSTNSDKKSSFGTDEQGIKIEVKQGSDTFNFVVGKPTSDNSGTYLAAPDFGKTYQVALDLNTVFSRADWRDLSIFSFVPERSEKIRFQYPDHQFTVENIANKWTGTKPAKFAVNTDKITSILGVLSSLTAAQIPAQSFANTGLEKHSIIIQVSGAGFDNTLMIGDCTKDNLCYAKTGASDNIYLINKSDRDALNKKMTDLK